MARDQALNLKRGWKRKHSNHAAAQGCSLSEAQADLESSAVASWAVSKAPTLEVNGRAVSLDGALEVALRLAAEDPDDKHIHAAVARLVHGDDRRVADELGLAVDSVRTYVQRGKEKLHAAYHRTGKYAPGATAR
jgi:DNA-directed RNA polymerase specialized sigma24 family protein